MAAYDEVAYQGWDDHQPLLEGSDQFDNGPVVGRTWAPAMADPGCIQTWYDGYEAAKRDLHLEQQLRDDWEAGVLAERQRIVQALISHGATAIAELVSTGDRIPVELCEPEGPGHRKPDQWRQSMAEDARRNCGLGGHPAPSLGF